ncbi:MAG: hypothetical protein R3C61_14920 [Bacteroidia bacterium]
MWTKDLQQTIDDDDRTLMMLDSAEVVDLQAMAENTVGPASVMAWNLYVLGTTCAAIILRHRKKVTTPGELTPPQRPRPDPVGILQTESVS